MAREKSATLTGREAQIMDVLWRLGVATAEQVREGLADPLHDSTVRTLLRVLESKGFVAHEAQGKAYVYQAAIARGKAQRHALREVLAQFFGGSAEALVLSLIEDDRLTAEQIDDLKQARSAGQRDISRGKKGSKGSKGSIKRKGE